MIITTSRTEPVTQQILGSSPIYPHNANIIMQAFTNQIEHKPYPEVHIAFVGGEGTGKTSIASKLTEGLPVYGEPSSLRCPPFVDTFKLGFDQHMDPCVMHNFKLSLFDSDQVPKPMPPVEKVAHITDYSMCSQKYSKIAQRLVAENVQYLIVTIDGLNGVDQTARLYFDLAEFLKLRLVVVITRTDLSTRHETIGTYYQVKQLLKSQRHTRIPIDIRSTANVVSLAGWLENPRVVPIFFTSTVEPDSHGLEHFRLFLSVVPNTLPFDCDRPLYVQVCKMYAVSGDHYLAHAVVQQGILCEGTRLWVDNVGEVPFCAVRVVKVFHNDRRVRSVSAGQVATLLVQYLCDSPLAQGSSDTPPLVNLEKSAVMIPIQPIDKDRDIATPDNRETVRCPEVANLIEVKITVMANDAILMAGQNGQLLSRSLRYPSQVLLLFDYTDCSDASGGIEVLDMARTSQTCRAYIKLSNCKRFVYEDMEFSMLFTSNLSLMGRVVKIITDTDEEKRINWLAQTSKPKKLKLSNPVDYLQLKYSKGSATTTTSINGDCKSSEIDSHGADMF
ncbi:hypothetical protein EV182_001877 [Spiromyces aspiralis]|uniref:Uncharacterized protein n=1 Tax=Spiromyces aspiralis TaxID=68401 RepID=A0ACC1HJ29_9FUNG|nr:hypothetical protein EV182_001877 [Spiromyces aspiralis]